MIRKNDMFQPIKYNCLFNIIKKNCPCHNNSGKIKIKIYLVHFEEEQKQDIQQHNALKRPQQFYKIKF